MGEGEPAGGWVCRGGNRFQEAGQKAFPMLRGRLALLLMVKGEGELLSLKHESYAGKCIVGELRLLLGTPPGRRQPQRQPSAQWQGPGVSGQMTKPALCAGPGPRGFRS